MEKAVVDAHEKDENEAYPEQPVADDRIVRMIGILLREASNEFGDRILQMFMVRPLLVDDQCHGGHGDKSQEDQRAPCLERRPPVGPWNLRHFQFQPGGGIFRRRHRLVRTRQKTVQDFVLFVHFDERVFRVVLKHVAVLPSGADTLPVVGHDDGLCKLLHEGAARNAASA